MERRRKGGRGGGGGGRSKIQKEDEGEIVDILLNLPQVVEKSELLNKLGYTWGRSKERSVSKSKSSPSSPRNIDESRPEKSTAVEDDQSPSTPLCSLPSGSGNDDAADNPKEQSSSKRISKRKVTDDLIRRYNEMQKEILLKRKREAMENRKLRKIKRQKIVETLHRHMKAKREEVNNKKMPPKPPPPPPSPPPQLQHPSENRKIRTIKRQKMRAMDTLLKKHRAQKLELEAKKVELKAKKKT